MTRPEMSPFDDSFDDPLGEMTWLDVAVLCVVLAAVLAEDRVRRVMGMSRVRPTLGDSPAPSTGDQK